MKSLLPLAMFAFVMSITPGPNNIMLTTSGLLFGFLRSIPHILGVVAGCGLMFALCAAGIGSMVAAVPAIHIALKAIGSAYLLYLAWRLRKISFSPDDDRHARPMSFIGAAAFQYVNPKAWVMSISGAAAFLPDVQPFAFAVALFCLVYCGIGLPCISVWAGTGAALRRCLAQPKWRRLFSAVMVLLTVYSAAAIWM
jgi:threonine/homoserine/homoserine lactone efflux protein